MELKSTIQKKYIIYIYIRDIKSREERINNLFNSTENARVCICSEG